MKRCYYFLTLLFVVFTVNSCSNEVDVLADYEENASIYGLLDPSEDVQYIKINKVFTNPDVAASSVAKISDSLYFDSIAPTLTEVETGRVIYLFKSNDLPKNNGYFSSSPNYLYSTKEKISPVFTYRLDLYLPKTNRHLSSTTNISDSVKLNSPQSVIIVPSVLEIPLDKNIVIVFNSTKESKIFDGYFYFNYMEVNKADTNIKVVKSIQWRLFTKLRSDDDLVPQTFTQRPVSSSFYDLLLAKIPVDPSLERRFLPCKMEFTAGNLELDNYIQATEPSIGIVQKQTEYSNIRNGIGLFASRRITSYSNVAIGKTTKNTIVTGTDYKQLGFVN